MSRRIFHILSSLGLGVLLLFTVAATPFTAYAHEVSKAPNPLTLNVSNQSYSFKTSPKINTNVLCQATYLGLGWNQTGNGPAGFGCGGSAWETTTPTSTFAYYDMGAITHTGRYNLRAFITNHANAPMDYSISATSPFSSINMQDCFYNQIGGLAWETICSFTIDSTLVNSNRNLIIFEESGAVSTHTMSSSAIQIQPA